MNVRKWVVPFLVSLLLLLLAASASSEPPVPALTMKDFDGENRQYWIDFLFFSRLAEGSLRFERTDDPDIFRAELVGKTLGIASWLSGDRRQTYTSTMQLMPDGSFNTIEHVAKIQKKKWGKWRRYRKVCHYDCAAGKIREENLQQGEVVSSKEFDIPGGQSPVDMLTAFYNLRLGIYGELQRGKTIYIPTYSSNGLTNIEVRVLTVEQQEKMSYFSADGVLVKAIIDPEIFDTDSGNLFVWFNDKGVPARGIIEDMIGLGDIKGYLVEDQL